MNIAIIGANSHIGTELSLLFRNQGMSVSPIVRSRLAASFLDYHGFECEVADITDLNEAREALHGADVVVLTAFAEQYSRGRFKPKQARRTNTELVQSTVEASPTNSVVIYFSSIAVYGPAVGFSRFDWYTKEKQHAETVLREECEKHSREGYALRMGPVVGPHQKSTQEIRSTLTDSEVHLNVASDRLSNIVHTVTIMDAIIACSECALDRDAYTLVNYPPWTWEDVFSYYAEEETTLRFHEQGDGWMPQRARSLLQSGSRLAQSHERSLRSVMVHLPGALNQRIFNEFVKRQASNNIQLPGQSDSVNLSVFRRDLAPGPTIPELRTTKSLLEFENEIADLFNTANDIGGYRGVRDQF